MKLLMFYDRYTAGKDLAKKLTKWKGESAVVYAIPRGGVLTAFEVAKSLEAPLELVITRKIPHPLNREVGICAITEEGERICDDRGVYGIDAEWIDFETTVQKNEIKRRRAAYGMEHAVISAEGKTAIIVDDGIATGLTMRAAIKAIQKQKPERIIVAVPVAPQTVVEQIEQLVDVVVVLKNESDFKGSVGAYYENFPEVFDREVIVACTYATEMSLYRKNKPLMHI